MAITTDDFNKIWASTSPLTPYSFSESQYKEGWNFIGSTPPSRQMWDFLQKQNDEKMQYLLNNYLPAVVGAVVAFAGSTTPQGWLLCDGSAVSRTTYAALFAVIGTTYGAGNGSTTFNLPNLVDKFVEGSATAGTVKSAGLPNITGSIGGGSGQGGPAGYGSGIGFLRDTMISGCFQPSANAYGNESGSGGVTLPSGYPVLTANLDASRSNTIYGKSTTVQPPALTMRYIIKY